MSFGTTEFNIFFKYIQDFNHKIINPNPRFFKDDEERSLYETELYASGRSNELDHFFINSKRNYQYDKELKETFNNWEKIERELILKKELDKDVYLKISADKIKKLQAILNTPNKNQTEFDNFKFEMKTYSYSPGYSGEVFYKEIPHPSYAYHIPRLYKLRNSYIERAIKLLESNLSILNLEAPNPYNRINTPLTSHELAYLFGLMRKHGIIDKDEEVTNLSKVIGHMFKTKKAKNGISHKTIQQDMYQVPFDKLGNLHKIALVIANEIGDELDK